MATTAKRLTYDDLESIPQERESDRHELIDGELVVTPAPIPRHQLVSIDLVVALAQFVRANRLGRVFDAPIDVRFTPDNVLSPDIVYIAQDRLQFVGPKTIDAPPDLVVEILSPRTRRRDLTVKRDLYARFGVREYWIVDLESRSVTTFALIEDRYEPILPEDVNFVTSRVLPDLVLGLNEIFGGLEDLKS